MDREQTLRELFPDIDARLIKATVLDGDDMASAVEFLINEAMQTKPDHVPHLAGNYGRLDGTLIISEKMAVVEEHTKRAYDNWENLTDLSCDKHEESIVWKGGFKVDQFVDQRVPHPELENRRADLHHQQWQPEETGLPETDQLIDWWAATWRAPIGLKEAAYECESSLSWAAAPTDSGTQEGTLAGSEMEKSKFLQGPTVDIFTSSTDLSPSTNLADAINALQPIHSIPTANSTARCLLTATESLFQGSLPRSQEASKVFTSKSLEEVFVGGDKPLHRFSPACSQRTEDYSSNDNDNKGALEHNADESGVLGLSIGQESMLESSRYNVNMEDLDRLVRDTNCSKDIMRKDIDSLTLLRQKLELEELAAQRAKTEVAGAGREGFKKVEEMQQQTSRERADYEMRAAEVYGEKAVLSMEARELKARLLEAQTEQSKALSTVEDIRCTLLARLQSTVEAKEMAMEEAEMKVKLANELLATEQAAEQQLEEDTKALEAEADKCKQLREFLVERGNIVDSLQGELAVLCEDILAFKREVDEGIPLSGSRALSWSRISHVTDHSSHHMAASSPPMSTMSKCLPSECSLSSTSIVSLESLMSELPKRARPIECTLHSQYFSPTNSIVEMGASRQGPDIAVVADGVAVQDS